MTQPAFNPFAGVNEAPQFGSGAFLEDGRYKLKITKVIYKDLFAGGSALIVETEVLESSNPAIPVGSARTWFQKKNESFKSAVKLFCIAATGYDNKNDAQAEYIKTKVEPMCEAVMMAAITKGALNGREVNVDVSKKPKKKTEGDFSLHTFSPASPPLPMG